MPPAALTNDMRVFYFPRELHADKVTTMELVCASVCITTMVCFTLEAKYRKENPFDQEVHMARHRMGARGNVTYFPLPWQDLLRELRELEQDSDEPPDLPTGAHTSPTSSPLSSRRTKSRARTPWLASFMKRVCVAVWW